MIDEFPSPHPGRKDYPEDIPADKAERVIKTDRPAFVGSYSHALGQMVLRKLRKVNASKKQKLSGGKADVDTSPVKQAVTPNDASSSTKTQRAKSSAQATLQQNSKPAFLREDLLVKALNKVLEKQKAKKKKVKLPVDLATSGTFHSKTISSTDTRLTECREMLRFINDTERNEIDRKAKFIVKVVKEEFRKPKPLRSIATSVTGHPKKKKPRIIASYVPLAVVPTQFAH